MTVMCNRGLQAADGPYVPGQGQGSKDGEAVRISPESGCAGGTEDVDLEDVIRQAFGTVGGLFNSCADKMQAMNDRFDRGELDDLKDAVKLAREMRGATLVMIEERNRIEKLRKDVAGGCGGAGALDLDAAREEIGRRLACLRRAAGG
ncbi:permease [Paracoccus suum]|uniref:Permease n=1 Tax=Paracoccus suum TaxID=2259340 RepID=A0A344PL89_9RHOB|nr:permease [Paracoccus suum]AXC50144.1 permease [Paracoccus suum]